MIYCAHGIIKSHFSNKICNKHLVDVCKFKNYLNAKSTKYVSLESALSGAGDAFTIDDSTYAALEMAKILREYGHQVTVFINPYYVEYEVSYWFFLLSYLLDRNFCADICFEGKQYSCASCKEKNFVRKKLKDITSLLPTELDRYDYLENIFKLDLTNIKLPHYLRTFNKSDVLMLKKIGVDVQNHGWTHKQLVGSEFPEITNEISMAKNWLADELEITSYYYAVPFGENLPQDSYNFVDIKCWFLQRNDMAYGLVKENVYNRAIFS